MPELPEVETVKETLKSIILGKTIIQVVVRYDKIIHGMSVSDFQNTLNGKTFTDIGRFGKYLFFYLNELVLISHLRMEGKFFIKPIQEPFEKHEHIIFVFSDGLSLRYHDTRKFGTMEIVNKGYEYLTDSIKKMGLEPFDPMFTGQYLQQKAQRSSRVVKVFLLDQNTISGLGNIYVDEVLFRSGIHPETPVNKLSSDDFVKLADSSRQVLMRAVDLGGTTIRSYLSSLGVSGRFQNELLVHMRDNELCYQCQTPIIKIKVGGRGTYLCPTCQKRKG